MPWRGAFPPPLPLPPLHAGLSALLDNEEELSGLLGHRATLACETLRDSLRMADVVQVGTLGPGLCVGSLLAADHGWATVLSEP
jgi:hypothetical protein